MERKRELYSSAIRSRQMITDALINLMKEKDYQDISVSEIMQRADLVRRTFYAHYKSKDEIIQAHINQLLSQSIDDILIGYKECDGSLPLVYFQLWSEHKEFVYLLSKNNQLQLLRVFEKYIRLINEEYNTFKNMGFGQFAEKYAPQFYAGALWTLLEIWVDNGMKESPKELSKLFSELFLVDNDVKELYRFK